MIGAHSCPNAALPTVALPLVHGTYSPTLPDGWCGFYKCTTCPLFIIYHDICGYFLFLFMIYVLLHPVLRWHQICEVMWFVWMVRLI
jgi:hypothetical protein